MSAPVVALEGSETAAVIEALGHYRDLLKAEGKSASAYEAALAKVCRFVSPASDTIVLSAPEVITWEPFGILPEQGSVRARLADHRLIVVNFLGDCWSWSLYDVHGEEVAGNWVDTKAEAQQAALAAL